MQEREQDDTPQKLLFKALDKKRLLNALNGIVKVVAKIHSVNFSSRHTK